MYEKAILGHYANHRTAEGFFVMPENDDEISKALAWAVSAGLKVCTLGSQNSFSDIFLAQGQLHISTLRMNRIIDFDRHNGEITIESGARICDVLKQIIPAGYYLTGLSGSYSDTIGGMISSDCHGKDSWKHGNFGDNVLQLKLMRADGTIATLDRDDELMKAVIAGLGMLGIVTEIKLKLRRIPSLIVSASQYKTDIKALPEHDNIKTEYQYAWLDMLNRNPCAIVRTASFDISKAHQTIDEDGFPKIKSTVRGLPPKTFWKLLGLFWNPRSYKVFNSFIRAIHREGKTQNQFIIDYLYPWRKYPSNKYLFKKDSFYELQVIFSQKKFVIAFEEIRALTKSYGIYPLSSVIKWHRRDDVLLSFSGDGLSIANTFEAALVNSAKGKDFLSKYTELCIGLEGKFYLSKYPYLNREQLQTSFVGFERWHRLKQETDPKNIFLSNTASKWILV